MTEPVVRLKPLRGEAARVFKLCLDKDRQVALQGLELAASLGPGSIPGILQGVSVNADGHLVRGARFTARPHSQPVLDALLIQQLGAALPGTPEATLRDQVVSLEMELPLVPHLAPFPHLQSVKITFPRGLGAVDLTPLGITPALRSLVLEQRYFFDSLGRPTLRSLAGLVAPLLEVLEASALDLEDISALEGSPTLKTINLSWNEALLSIDSLAASCLSLEKVDISGCPGITSLKPLRKATRLRVLDIYGLSQIEDLSDLDIAETLESVDVSHCAALKSLSGVPLLALADRIRRAEGDGSHEVFLFDLPKLASLEGVGTVDARVVRLSLKRLPVLADLNALPSAMASLRILELDEVGVADLEVLSLLTQLETLNITNCKKLVDARAIGRLTNLRSVSITSCPKLKVLPEAWSSPVKQLVLKGCGALKPLKAIPAGLDRRFIEIDDRRLLPRAKPVRTLKEDLGSIWKLLSSREIPNVLLGLELADTLGEALDPLVEGVSVQDGALIRGKRFTGSGPAQPFLDLALVGLMCRARSDSRLSRFRAEITRLELSLCSRAPQLEGFTSLESLTLEVLDDQTPDLLPFGVLPKLRELKINRARTSSPGRLLSLNGLEAPSLVNVDLARCGLEEVSGLLRSSVVCRLDLSENTYLRDLDGLRTCAPNLVDLNLSKCSGIKSIDVLAGARQLQVLNLLDCKALESIEPLAACLALTEVHLERCASLRSLRGLADLPLRVKEQYNGVRTFSLDGCAALQSLDHLPDFGGALTHLSIDWTGSLGSLEGLRRLSSVISLSVNESGMRDLNGIQALSSLAKVSMRGCKSLGDATLLGSLNSLATLDLSGSAVSRLPEDWSGPLASMFAEECTALTSIGVLPRSVKELVVRGCPGLKSLRGLGGCPDIDRVAVPITVEDLSDLREVAVVTIDIDLNEIPLGKVKGEVQKLPEALIAALNDLKSLRLSVRGPTNYGYPRPSFDLASFARLKRLESLSFEHFNFYFADLAGLAWLIEFEGLRKVQFAPRGWMAHKLDSGVYDSPNKVRALQRRICKDAGLALPAHLG